MSNDSPDVEPQVAAEVSGNEAGRFIVWKEYGFENSDVGTEFLIKSDAEEAIKEARQRERQKILDKIEEMLEENQEMKDRLLPIADNAVHGELRAREQTLEELRDVLQQLESDN